MNRFDKLNRIVKELKNTLEEYAYNPDFIVRSGCQESDDFEFITYDGPYSLYESGKLARDVLKKLEVIFDK